MAGGKQWYGEDFYIARYLVNGALDMSFGKAGIVSVDMGENNDFANDLKIDGAGRIVVVGSSGDNMALLRLNTNGSLDKSFGVGGKVFTSIRDVSIAHNFELLSNGQILVAGTSGLRPNFIAQAFDPVVARFNANGTLDASFGTNGYAWCNSIAIRRSKRSLPTWQSNPMDALS